MPKQMPMKRAGTGDLPTGVQNVVADNGTELAVKEGATEAEIQALVAAAEAAPPKPKTRSPRVPKSEVIVVPELDTRMFEVTVVGLSPYISHQWSEKARKTLVDKVTGQAPEGRKPVNPEEVFEATIYRLPDGRPGIPAIAFKLAAVDAASQIPGLTKVLSRAAFHIFGLDGSDLLPIVSPNEPKMRLDMVRVGMGTEPRYRAEFWPWRVVLPIHYNAGVMTPAQIINLLRHGGFGVGVGDWRTQKDGKNGMFDIARGEE